MNSTKYVVLLSAGLDSTTNLYAAYTKGEVSLAVSFDYGQRAASMEMASAKMIARDLGIPHRIIDLPWFKDFGKSSLIDKNIQIPTGKNVAIDDNVISQKTAQSVWVPNRNGIFLNIGAGFAESLDAHFVVPGFNREEAATFPDNSQLFSDTLNSSLALSTSNQIKVHCFTQNLDKTEIVQLGLELGVDFSKIWPCYFSGLKWCGQCESCQRSLRALSANGVNFKGWVES